VGEFSWICDEFIQPEAFERPKAFAHFHIFINNFNSLRNFSRTGRAGREAHLHRRKTRYAGVYSPMAKDKPWKCCPRK
jgi:hypothetical protein